MLLQILVYFKICKTVFTISVEEARELFKILSKKIALQDLYNNGCRNPKKLSMLTKLHLSTIYRNLAKLRKGTAAVRKQGSGRSRFLKNKDKLRLYQLVRKDNMRTASDLQHEMVKRGSPRVSTTTIRRYLNEGGFTCKTPKFKPLLTASHKEKRLDWCKKHQKTKWGRWIFSDESRFQLFTNCVRRWSTATPKKPRPKFPQAIMV